MPADRLGDVEVHAGQVGDGAVGELLHPVAERLAARRSAGRVGVEGGDGLVDRPPGRIRSAVASISSSSRLSSSQPQA